MSTVTKATVRAHIGHLQRIIPADCWGSSMAILCPACEAHPILLTARSGWRGSSEDRPAQCGSCDTEVWMISSVDSGVTIHGVELLIRRPEG